MRDVKLGRDVKAPGANNQTQLNVYPPLPRHSFEAQSPLPQGPLALLDGLTQSPGVDGELERDLEGIMPSESGLSISQFSGSALTADLLSEHTQACKSPCASGSAAALVPVPSPTNRMRRPHSVESLSCVAPPSIASTVHESEEKCPEHLGNEDRWQWKLRQLDYGNALPGSKRWGARAQNRVALCEGGRR